MKINTNLPYKHNLNKKTVRSSSHIQSLTHISKIPQKGLETKVPEEIEPTSASTCFHSEQS